MNIIFKHRFGIISLIAIFVVFFSSLTRLVLLFLSWKEITITPVNIIGVFVIGLFYDLVVASFFCIPVALFIWLMKDSWYRKKWNRVLLFLLLAIILTILIINVVGEIVFWDEFGVRYNFIAVDYLIYTNEVIGNIQESYNIKAIFAAVLLLVIFTLYLFRKAIKSSQMDSMRFLKRSQAFFVFLLFPVFFYFFANNRFKLFSKNNYVNELAGAGIYEFGAAFWHNEIDYEKFYKINSNTDNIAILKKMMAEPSSFFLNDSLSVDRQIISQFPSHKWNVVLISMESFSADFMKTFGNAQQITPVLDSLVKQSIFFDHFYATGTRTVRGLEALSLSIPPTPGQSIVRRPNNENMFTMGSVLKSKGYDVKYIYGGNSFFDNMGYFFGNSGYQVIDKKDIPDKDIHHETSWGVADEDAFKVTLDECDKSYQQGKLFFNHIMTVSNHRPFTYPEGRIDIPSSRKCREGAVKYTDYAIGQFLKEAQNKPWFDSTLFVIVADHCAGSAGRTDLPVMRYHIPCFIYAPSLVQPSIQPNVMSQIDLAPTILGLMNISYKSRFLGYDIFKTKKENERLFISTYQDMGYIKNDTLIILSPKNMVRMFKIDFNSDATISLPVNTRLLNEAISWYQGASYLYNHEKYTLKISK